MLSLPYNILSLAPRHSIGENGRSWPVTKLIFLPAQVAQAVVLAANFANGRAIGADIALVHIQACWRIQ